MQDAFPSLNEEDAGRDPASRRAYRRCIRWPPSPLRDAGRMSHADWFASTQRPSRDAQGRVPLGACWKASRLCVPAYPTLTPSPAVTWALWQILKETFLVLLHSLLKGKVVWLYSPLLRHKPTARFSEPLVVEATLYSSSPTTGSSCQAAGPHPWSCFLLHFYTFCAFHECLVRLKQPHFNMFKSLSVPAPATGLVVRSQGEHKTLGL